MLIILFWRKIFYGNWNTLEYINHTSLIGALKAAVTVLISMGALLGKIDIFQWLVLVIF